MKKARIFLLCAGIISISICWILSDQKAKAAEEAAWRSDMADAASTAGPINSIDSQLRFTDHLSLSKKEYDALLESYRRNHGLGWQRHVSRGTNGYFILRNLTVRKDSIEIYDHSDGTKEHYIGSIKASL